MTIAHDDEETRTLVTAKLYHFLGTRQTTICPSEIPRALEKEGLITGWRDFMDITRHIAFEMREQGILDVLQKGNVVGKEVDLDNIKGPIRLKAI